MDLKRISLSLFIISVLFIISACDDNNTNIEIDNDEPVQVNFTGYHPCITSISVNLRQGSSSTNTTLPLRNGSGSASFTGIDSTQPVTITVRVLSSTDCPEPVFFEHVFTGVLPQDESGLPTHAPANCNLNVELRDQNTMTTHNGQHYSDYAVVESPPDSGDFHQFNPHLLPSQPDRLGHTEGVYINGTMVIGNGYYKKLEVDVSVASPCRIVDMRRDMETFSDHNFSDQHTRRPDNINFNRSRPVAEDQHWVITDAPGIFTTQITQATVFHKRYTLAIEINNGNETLTFRYNYEVRVAVDINGDLVDPE